MYNAPPWKRNNTQKLWGQTRRGYKLGLLLPLALYNDYYYYYVKFCFTLAL
jgi:hypothetical protein